MRYEKVGLGDAVVILLPPILGQLGTIVKSPTGVAIILSLLIYMLSLAVIFGKMAESLINLSLKGGIIVKKVNYKNHIVICGWNYQGTKIIDNLLSDDICSKIPIVILADLEKVPYDSDNVDFIRGCPYKKEDLIRAGIPTADTAIILTDIRHEKTSNPDADALMIALAIEDLNKDVYTCVQLLCSDNRIHLENAHADEIICLDQFGVNLVTSCALNHGLSNILNELLTFKKGYEIYKYKGNIPDKYVGKSFVEVGKQLLDTQKILVAIETKKDDYVIKECTEEWLHSSGEGKIVMINPGEKYRIRKDDTLFIISETEPTEL